MKFRVLLLSGSAPLAMAVVALTWIYRTTPHDPLSISTSASPAPSQRQKHREKPTPNLYRAALTEPNGFRRQELLRKCSDTIEPGEIKTWLDFVDSKPDADLRADIRRALLQSWIERDLTGMISWFGERYAADETHQESRDLLIQTITGREPAETFAWMETSLSKSVRQELYGSFFQHWAGRNPAAAATALTRLVEASDADPADWTRVIGQVATQWAGADLNGALIWAETLPEGAARSEALVRISHRWAQKDPHAAAAYAVREYNVSLLDAVAGTWSINDPRAAATWVTRLPTGEVRNSAIASVAAVWTQKDPAAAAAWANGLPADSTGDQARISVASMWATIDPTKAAEWAGEFPEGFLRERALEPVVNTWALNDSNAAGQWLSRLPDTASRNVAVAAFCSVLEGIDPPASFEWAQTITNESIRKQRMESAAWAWDKIVR